MLDDIPILQIIQAAFSEYVCSIIPKYFTWWNDDENRFEKYHHFKVKRMFCHQPLNWKQ